MNITHESYEYIKFCCSTIVYCCVQDPVPTKKASPPPAGAGEAGALDNPATLLMGPPGEPEMVGWLFKQGGNVKSWKKRWVVLSNFVCIMFFLLAATACILYSTSMSFLSDS